MKIKVTQAKLSKALNNVSRIAIGRVTLPILNNVITYNELNLKHWILPY